MEQNKLDYLKTQLESMSTDDYEVGKPYNCAHDIASDYDEFKECARIIEEIGRIKGMSEERLVADYSTYSEIYYPQEMHYYVRDGERHSYAVPFNANEEAGLSTIVLDKHTFSLNLGEYSISEEGVYCTRIEKGEERKELICNHPIVPIGIQVGNNHRQQVIISSVRHGKLQVLHFFKTVVYQSSKIMSLLDYDIDASKELCSYFKRIEDLNRGIVPDFKEYKTATHLGWLDQTYKTFYPYEAHDYYSNLADTYPVEFDAILDSKGNLEQWKALVNRFRDHEHIHARIALAASFAAALVQPLGGQPFILHLWGFSGSGKTVALSTAAGVWANPHPTKGYKKSFNATDISLIEYAKFCYSLPCCIDELQSYKAKTPKDFSDLVFGLCTGHPRIRSKGTGGLQRQTSWMNCSITTGEQPLIEAHTQTAGAVNRVVQIECPDYLFWSDGATIREYCNEMFNCYGVAGRAFISYLLADNNLDHARKVYHDFCDVLEKSKATEKQAHETALILTADTLVGEWIFQDEIRITVEDIMPFLQTKRDINTAEHIHSMVLDWIIKHTNQLEKEDIGKFGEIDGKKVCFITQKEFKALMSELNFSSDAYCKWAKESGKLITDEGRSRKNTRLKGITTSCICILYDD